VRLANFEIDHIVSLKYGGEESIGNLCLTCAQRVEQRFGEMLLGNFPCQNNP